MKANSQQKDVGERSADGNSKSLTPKAPSQKKDIGNSVLIGGKYFMNYVNAVNFQFKKGEKEVIIKARGKWISRAVDVSQSVMRIFKGFVEKEIKKVTIGTTEFEKEGKKINVSTIEIIMGVNQ